MGSGEENLGWRKEPKKLPQALSEQRKSKEGSGDWSSAGEGVPGGEVGEVQGMGGEGVDFLGPREFEGPLVWEK